MKEKLQEYALIAEILSAICIVLSLIFVGLQVQQGAEETAANSEAIQSQVRESMMSTDMDVLSISIEHPMLMDVGFDSSTMTNEEHLMRLAYFYMMTRTRENYYLQHQQGILDEETYHSYMIVMARLVVANDYYRQIWNQILIEYNPVQGFVDEMNRMIQEYSDEIKNGARTIILEKKH